MTKIKTKKSPQKKYMIKLEKNQIKNIENLNLIFQGIDVYDKKKYKLDDKNINLVLNLPSVELYNKKDKKLDGIYRKVNPDNLEEKQNEAKPITRKN